MGKECTCEYPCGHCISCLHNNQDSWSIRIRETVEHFHSFVYDTLTFATPSLSYRNITDKVLSVGFDRFPKDVQNLIDRYSTFDRETGEYLALAPCIDKKIVQNWIKRGRENFFLKHGYRPKMKYFFVEELGPKTSRPHLHCLIFGLSRADYVEFFAKPWRRDFGFTKTKFIEGGTDKDRDCISRYLSKYVSKGVFESPLVQFGLIDKPFRLISKGIGVEYLNNKVFDFFKSWKCEYFKGISVPKGSEGGTMVRTAYLRYFFESVIEKNIDIDFSKLGWRLTTYYDRNGFAHALPRYYRHKLSNYYQPNLLSYALQSYLLACSELYYHKKIQEYGDSLGFLPDYSKVSSPFAGYSRELFDFLVDKFTAAQRLQAQVEGRRRFTKLKNHYGRAMNLQYSFAN